MKKNTLITFVIFAISFASFAQTLEERQKIVTNYDLEKLDRMARKASEKFTASHKKALELAAIKGWELMKELPNGGTAQLIGVTENGQPIYVVMDNREGAITTRADKVHSGGGAGLDLNGENMIIGLWDQGSVRTTHELFTSPIYQIDEAVNLSNHTTHIAGTLIGSGDVQEGAAKGMAPEAELWVHDSLNDGAEWINAAANGMLISNMSYHVNISDYAIWEFGYYSAFSQFVDNVTYNAPYALPIFSGGNFRNDGYNFLDGGYDYMLHFTIAKNCLAVAAVEEVLNYSGPNDVIMPEFSSWGPTDDGRIKPDISAKGVDMFSSVSDADNAYTNYSGTSMSAPNATGSLILLQQHYNNLNGNYMLASTLKGLALHTADEAGDHPGPDYRFGWGLLNIERGASVITDNGASSLIVEEALQNGEVYSLTVQSNGIDDLSISIAWTDPPAVPVEASLSVAYDNPTPMLINDLDLRVSKDGGATFFPWKLDPANFNAAATTGDNELDNIEKVDVVGATGEYLIQVSHKGSELVNSQQAFSLIVTGLEEQLSVEDFNFEGLVIHPNPSNGMFTLSNTNNLVLTNAIIYDMNGRQIKSIDLEHMNGSTSIDLSSAESGMYLMIVNSMDAKHTIKLLKQ
jgi:subtilisin family serine protease